MKYFISVFVLFITVNVQAQFVVNNPGSNSRHQLNLSLALEPEIVMLFNYTYGLSNEDCSTCFRIGSGLKIPTTVFSNNAWRVHLIGSVNWLSEEKWGITAASYFYLVHNKNLAGEIAGLGFELRANPGYFGSDWAAALDIGWQNTFASYINHSEKTKSNFKDKYPDDVKGISEPTDGWYGSTANRFRIGLLGAHNFSEKLSLTIALGTLFATQKQGLFFSFDFAQLPLYLESSFSLGL